jgi:hypothetical protein
VQAAELEERGRLLYKTKAAIEGLQAELSKARDLEEQFKEQARVAFTEQSASFSRPPCPRPHRHTVWRPWIDCMPRSTGRFSCVAREKTRTEARGTAMKKW